MGRTPLAALLPVACWSHRRRMRRRHTARRESRQPGAAARRSWMLLTTATRRCAATFFGRGWLSLPLSINYAGMPVLTTSIIAFAAACCDPLTSTGH